MALPPIPPEDDYQATEDFLDAFSDATPSQQLEAAASHDLTWRLVESLSRRMVHWRRYGHATPEHFERFFVALASNPSLGALTSTGAVVDALQMMAEPEFAGEWPTAIVEAWATSPAMPFHELTGEIDQAVNLPTVFRSLRLIVLRLLPTHSSSLRLAQPATAAQATRFFPEVRKLLRAAHAEGSDVEYERASVRQLERLGPGYAHGASSWNDLDKLLRADFHRAYDRKSRLAFEASYLLWIAVMAKLFAPNAFVERLNAPTFWAFVRTRSLYTAPPWFFSKTKSRSR